MRLKTANMLGMLILCAFLISRMIDNHEPVMLVAALCGFVLGFPCGKLIMVPLMKSTLVGDIAYSNKRMIIIAFIIGGAPGALISLLYNFGRLSSLTIYILLYLFGWMLISGSLIFHFFITKYEIKIGRKVYPHKGPLPNACELVKIAQEHIHSGNKAITREIINFALRKYPENKGVLNISKELGTNNI